MGAQSGSKGQRPPNMQAMNMQQGWGGGWQPQQGQAYFTPQGGPMPNPNQPQYGQTPAQGGGYGGSPTMGFGGSWWGPQAPGGPMASWGQVGGNMPSPNMPPANMRPPTDGINPPPGGNAPPAPGAPPAPAGVDFYAGFDPKKSIWGEAGRNAYAADKANEYFRTQASGEALYNQWKKINAENPWAARAFRHSVMGMGGGQNDFEKQLLQREFGGDTEKWNQYRNFAHGQGMEGAEGGFNLLTGEYTPPGQATAAGIQGYKTQGWNPAAFQRQGAAPSGPWDAYAPLGSPNNPRLPPAQTNNPAVSGPAPGGAIAPAGNAPAPVGSAELLSGMALPWQKAAQPAPMRVRDNRWRGLNPGGNPAWQNMAITN